MAGLSKEQLAGKAAYTEANKDIPDAPEWKDLDDAQRQPWIDSVLDAEKQANPLMKADEKGSVSLATKEEQEEFAKTKGNDAGSADTANAASDGSATLQPAHHGTGDPQAKVNEAAASAAKVKEQQENAVPVALVDPEIEKCLTVRDLAKAEYQKQMGGSIEDFDALPVADIEQWESLVKMKNR